MSGRQPGWRPVNPSFARYKELADLRRAVTPPRPRLEVLADKIVERRRMLEANGRDPHGDTLLVEWEQEHAELATLYRGEATAAHATTDPDVADLHESYEKQHEAVIDAISDATRRGQGRPRQEAVAQFFDVNPATVRRWVNRERSPSCTHGRWSDFLNAGMIRAGAPRASTAR